MRRRFRAKALRVVEIVYKVLWGVSVAVGIFILMLRSRGDRAQGRRP